MLASDIEELSLVWGFPQLPVVVISEPLGKNLEVLATKQ